MIAGRRGFRAWRDASFVALDFETTGLDVSNDHVVSYGLVPIDASRIRVQGSLYGVVRPPMAPPPTSIRVHGIRPSDLQAAPDLGAVAAEIVASLQGRVLVAHAAWIELSFLHRIYSLAGGRAPRRAVDVLGLAAELAGRGDACQPESARLASLAEAYGVPVARTHHAFGDALMTAQLFLVLATRLEQRGVKTIRALERAGRSQNARNFFTRPP